MRIDPCQNRCNVISIWQVTIKFQIYDLVSRIFICYLSKLWGNYALILEVKNDNDLSLYWFQNEYVNIKRIWKNKYTKNLYFLSNIPKKFIKYWPLILHSILLNSSMMNTNWFTKKRRMKEKKKGIYYCIMIHNCSLLRLWDSLGFHIFVLCIHLLLWRVWEIRCFTLYT